jgi:RNA polymerase sigma factor for flagellar operon FliA
MSRSHAEDFADLESQGVLGLIEAVDHFRPEFGARLSTYATFKIRSKVLDYLRELDWLPRTARQRVRAVQGATLALENRFQRLPTDNELAEYLQLDMGTLQKALVDSSRTVISLDDELSYDTGDEGTSFHERLKDEGQLDPSEEYEQSDLQDHLIKGLKILPEREQIILSLYYYDELTYKEIGKALDISESRVCQIHGRAMLNIKTYLETTEFGSKKLQKKRGAA